MVLFGSITTSNTVGRTGIDACGESVSRRNSSEYAVLFSLRQEAPASIGGNVHTYGLNVLWFKNTGVPMKKLLVAAMLGFVCADAAASLRIDVKNDSSEDCSIAINARTDKTKWITEGWYVFASGDEAPIILDGVNDMRNVFIYNDCQKVLPKNAETKKVWVKTNYKFSDDLPKDNEKGYEEVVFTRLNSTRYVISD